MFWWRFLSEREAAATVSRGKRRDEGKLGPEEGRFGGPAGGDRVLGEAPDGILGIQNPVTVCSPLCVSRPPELRLLEKIQKGNVYIFLGNPSQRGLHPAACPRGKSLNNTKRVNTLRGKQAAAWAHRICMLQQTGQRIRFRIKKKGGGQKQTKIGGSFTR